MFDKENRQSILVSGLPLSRGNPTHYEHEDDTAYVELMGRDGVHAIHTPQDLYRRVHEYMHACYSTAADMEDNFSRVELTVADCVEDCWNHTRNWPWEHWNTPQIHQESARAFMRRERTLLNQHLAVHPEQQGQWGQFATNLRQAAIKAALGENDGNMYRSFTTKAERRLAWQLINLIHNGHKKQAAEMLHQIFFGPLKDDPKKPPKVRKPGEIKVPGEDDVAGDQPPNPEDADDPGTRSPKLEVVELDHCIHHPKAKVGYRKAIMGPRLHRPSLRKPFLPAKMFVKKAPVLPGGTILIDASGSMGDFNEIIKWMETSPFGTIAYYAGDTYRGCGWLYVYARKGWHAPEVKHLPDRENVVDGPAMDWLMKQARPRTFVTDRQFCGAADSTMQVVRLRRLEKQGELEVRDYRFE